MKQYKLIENNIIHDITEFPNNNKYWRLNGKRHRTDGPAVEWTDGYKEYWYNNKRILNINSDQEFKRYIKLLSIS